MSVTNILIGMGVLGKSELAGERIFTALDNKDQDELSEELPYYLVNDMAPILSYKEKMKDLLLTFKLEVFKTLDIVLTFGDNDGD